MRRSDGTPAAPHKLPCPLTFQRVSGGWESAHKDVDTMPRARSPGLTSQGPHTRVSCASSLLPRCLGDSGICDQEPRKMAFLQMTVLNPLLQVSLYFLKLHWSYNCAWESLIAFHRFKWVKGSRENRIGLTRLPFIKAGVPQDL